MRMIIKTNLTEVSWKTQIKENGIHDLSDYLLIVSTNTIQQFTQSTNHDHTNQTFFLHSWKDNHDHAKRHKK